MAQTRNKKGVKVNKSRTTKTINNQQRVPQTRMLERVKIRAKPELKVSKNLMKA